MIVIYIIWLFKSVHFIFLIERHKFSRIIFSYIILPISTAEFGCQGISSSCSLVYRIIPVIQSSLLRSCYFFSTKVGRYRVNSSLVHDILIYLNRIPIIKIISRASSWESHHSLPYHILLIRTWICMIGVGMLGCMMMKLNSLCCRRVSFFGHGSWSPDSILTMCGLNFYRWMISLQFLF